MYNTTDVLDKQTQKNNRTQSSAERRKLALEMEFYSLRAILEASPTLKRMALERKQRIEAMRKGS